jgi:single-strand DNA-binding protein
MNKFTASGYLGRDPEIKMTSNGKHTTAINLGVSGNKDHEEWLYITAYDKTADLICQYQKKGNFVIVDGHIHVSKNTTQDGQKISKTYLIADRVEFVNTHNDNSTVRNNNPSQNGQNQATGYTSQGITADDLPF